VPPIPYPPINLDPVPCTPSTPVTPTTPTTPTTPSPIGGTCNNQNADDYTAKLIATRENAALMSKPDNYQTCTYTEKNVSGYTIGFGTHLPDHPELGIANAPGVCITKAKALDIFSQTLGSYKATAQKQAAAAGICDKCLIAALTSADYQWGDFFAKRPAIAAQIKAGNYDQAATMINNDYYWNHQVGGHGTPDRANDLANALRAAAPKGTGC
jgi:GH24 family phage-related lysozyme (muramidase)